MLCDLSVLLRQVALLQHPRGGVARLHGDAWLGMLDRLGGTTEFSAGAGRCLKDAPYRKVAVEQTQLQRTLALSKQLLNRCADPQRQVPIEESQRA